jgi:hypothetical protein
MKVAYTNSIEYKVLQVIETIPSEIILRSDFAKVGCQTQAALVLKNLVAQGKLVRMGYGIYAKAKISEYTGKPIIRKNFASLAKEALDRLGVAWEPDWAEAEYNAGRSTQVPAKLFVRLKNKDRFKRKIAWGNMRLNYA